MTSDEREKERSDVHQLREGRSVAWVVTVTDTVAASYVAMLSVCAASAAEAAALRKKGSRPIAYCTFEETPFLYLLAFVKFGHTSGDGLA